MSQTFRINTLHRGKYMLCFFLMLFAIGGISALIPIQEMVKIIVILFTIPGILYCSVKFSQQPTTWTLTDDYLTIANDHKSISYTYAEIDHIRSLTRSGGNLYVIYRKKKSPARYWRNKLFQEDDDQLLLHETLLESKIEYYKF